jgi:hypothetical protein
MNNKTYERLVKPMRTDKHWFSYLYRDDNYRIFLIDFSLSAKEEKKYYHFSLFRMPCVLDVKPLYL